MNDIENIEEFTEFIEFIEFTYVLDVCPPDMKEYYQ